MAVDEQVDGFMTEADGVMLLSVPTDLFRTQVVPYELFDDARKVIGPLARRQLAQSCRAQ